MCGLCSGRKEHLKTVARGNEKDPTFISYLELSMQMQELLGQVGNKMEAVSDYCQSVIRWIDTYNDH